MKQQSDKLSHKALNNYLPYSNAIEFIDRQEELRELERRFERVGDGALVAITGQRGIGKTELALQYALQHQEENSPGSCIWLDAKTDVGIQIIAQFLKIYQEAEVTRALGNKALNLEQQVAYCWQNWPEGNVLAVWDDVADYKNIKPYLPPINSRFQGLITATKRLENSKSIEHLSLDVLDEAGALALLGAITGGDRIQEEIAQAKELCATLGFLPLGLDLVGHYLATQPEISLAEMLEKLASQSLLEESQAKKLQGKITAQQAVKAAFELSWQTLNDDAKQLGCVLSLFAPAPIPWSFVEKATLVRRREQIVPARDNLLLKKHLLQPIDEEIYRLHPLLREFWQEKMETSDLVEAQKQVFCENLIAVAEKIPHSPDLQLIFDMAIAIPHIAAIATELAEFISHEDLMTPFARLARYYESQGFYAQAESWRKLGIQVNQDRFGSEHPYVSTLADNLAVLYLSQYRYQEAEQLLVQALQINQKILGNDHLLVAQNANNLATVYQHQERYQDAEALYLKALDVRRRMLEPRHIEIAVSLNNLGTLYRTVGRYEQAEPLFLEALAIRERWFGKDNIEVVVAIAALANLYREWHRYDKAEPLYKQALLLRKNLLSELHPDVAASFNSLGRLYQSQGRYKEAEPLFVKALEIWHGLGVRENPDVATCTNNLAEIYRVLGQYREAEILNKQALAIRKRFWGEFHPDICQSLNNLAGLYQVSGRYEEAESLFLQALELNERYLGPEHPDTAYTMNNIGCLYYYQKRYREAEKLLVQSLDIRERRLGHSHSETVQARHNLNYLWGEMKKENIPTRAVRGKKGKRKKAKPKGLAKGFG